MVKKMVITLANGQVINAFQKNVSEGQKFLVIKEGVLFVDEKVDRGGKPLGLKMMTSYVPYEQVMLIEEHLVDEPEPGARPQPDKPTIKMWRMGAREEINPIPES